MSRRPGGKYPKIKIFTVAEFMAGKKSDMPPIRKVSQTFKQAEGHRPKDGEQFEIRDDS